MLYLCSIKLNETEMKSKFLATVSEMSNLVGMFGVYVVEGKIKARIFIKGKADNKYFICQAISPLTGEPNVAKLMTLDELKNWLFLPDLESFNEVLSDYSNNKRFTYNFPI